METVLLQQFEEYLRTRGIRAEVGDNEGNGTTGKRKKRSMPSIADKLSGEEVETSFFVKPAVQIPINTKSFLIRCVQKFLFKNLIQLIYIS